MSNLPSIKKPWRITEWPVAGCFCIFCAEIVAVCTGTKNHGICSCGVCCKRLVVSFGMTEQEIKHDQDRIAEIVSRDLEMEIWVADADWLSLTDFLGFLAVRPCAGPST